MCRTAPVPREKLSFPQNRALVCSVGPGLDRTQIAPICAPPCARTEMPPATERAIGVRVPATVWCPRRRLIGAGEVDGDGVAARAGGVVDPGLHVALVLLGCAAGQVERVRDPVRADDPVRRAGEGMVLLGPS